MCLIVFAWQQHADFPLILAANRDEFHARPTEPMGWWPGESGVLGGRDLEAGGSWLAVSRSGRLAAVTNVREAQAPQPARSRGDIVAGFVASSDTPEQFTKRLNPTDFAGFNALFGDADSLYFASNRGTGDAAPRRLDSGIFGVSNASLDTPWEKLTRGRSALERFTGQANLDLDELFDVIADRRPAEDVDPSAAGLPTSLARAASAPFIVTPNYGTRCTTAIIVRGDGHVEIGERRFAADGSTTGESRFVYRAG